MPDEESEHTEDKDHTQDLDKLAEQLAKEAMEDDFDIDSWDASHDDAFVGEVWKKAVIPYFLQGFGAYVRAVMNKMKIDVAWEVEVQGDTAKETVKTPILTLISSQLAWDMTSVLVGEKKDPTETLQRNILERTIDLLRHATKAIDVPLKQDDPKLAVAVRAALSTPNES